MIPYYQREPGLLLRALQSVTAQKVDDDVQVHVVIVDDQSPLPAEHDVNQCALPDFVAVEIIKQSNAGAGAARNTGLEAIDPKATQFVAFLDSDDTWHEDHLQTALQMLENSQFYFSNSLDDDVDSFSHFDWFKHRHRTTTGGHYEPSSAVITADEALDVLLCHCVAHTSQVVYEFPRASRLRFDTKQLRAGEDQLFFIGLCKSVDAVSYSTRIMGERGAGVSIYRATLSWDSPDGPDRIIDTMLLWRKVATIEGLSPEQQRRLKESSRTTSTHFLFIILRHLTSQPRVTLKAFKRVVLRHPQLLLDMVHAPARLRAHRRALQRSS